MTSEVSDERLAEIAGAIDFRAKTTAVMMSGECSSIITELQQRRAEARREPQVGGRRQWFDLTGDARLGACATDGCGGQPVKRLEAGGVGSNYCSGCAAKIQTRQEPPGPAAVTEAEIDAAKAILDQWRGSQPNRPTVRAALEAAFAARPTTRQDGDATDQEMGAACRKYNIGTLERLDEVMGRLRSVEVARPAEPVVKGLEWRQIIPGRMFADLYMIERLYLDDWRLFLRANNHGDWPKFLAGPFSLEEAKAAAQADYEQRIRSALVSTAGEPVEESMIQEAYDIIVSGDPPFTARECRASVVLSKALASKALASIDEVKDGE